MGYFSPTEYQGRTGEFRPDVAAVRQERHETVQKRLRAHNLHYDKIISSKPYVQEYFSLCGKINLEMLMPFQLFKKWGTHIMNITLKSSSQIRTASSNPFPFMEGKLTKSHFLRPFQQIVALMLDDRPGKHSRNLHKSVIRCLSLRSNASGLCCLRRNVASLEIKSRFEDTERHQNR